jgi:hypothetical protein
MTESRFRFKGAGKTVARGYSEREVTFMGIAGELLVAKALDMHFNPFNHRGGDGHRRDLWRGPVTVSVKTRGKGLPAHFMFPPHQQPKGFPDDYGVVGVWQRPYTVLDIRGYFSWLDFDRHHEVLTVGKNKMSETHGNNRIGMHERHLRPIQELILEMDMVPDETFPLTEAGGYLGYLRNRQRSTGSGVR